MPNLSDLCDLRWSTWSPLTWISSGLCFLQVHAGFVVTRWPWLPFVTFLSPEEWVSRVWVMCSVYCMCWHSWCSQICKANTCDSILRLLMDWLCPVHPTLQNQHKPPIMSQVVCRTLKVARHPKLNKREFTVCWLWKCDHLKPLLFTNSIV